MRTGAMQGVLLAAGLALLAACDTTTTTSSRTRTQSELDQYFGGGGGQGPRGGSGSGQSGAVSAPRPNDPSMDWADPCALNLEEIAGALLLYYSSHGAMPGTLSQLPNRGLSGTPLSISCPESGQPYVYQAAGLRAPLGLAPAARAPGDAGGSGEGYLLILYDGAPAHKLVQHLTDGKSDVDLAKTVRFGIVMEPPVANRPVQLFVVPIEQNLLDMYLRANGKK